MNSETWTIPISLDRLCIGDNKTHLSLGAKCVMNILLMLHPWLKYTKNTLNAQKKWELYRELVLNTEIMSDLYESVKSTEWLTNHWLNKFPNSPSSKEQRKEKQVNRLKDKKWLWLEIIYKQTWKYIPYPHDFTKPLPWET